MKRYAIQTTLLLGLVLITSIHAQTRYPCASNDQLTMRSQGPLRLVNAWYVSSPKDSGAFSTFTLEVRNSSRKKIIQAVIEFSFFDEEGSKQQSLIIYLGRNYENAKKLVGISSSYFTSIQEITSLRPDQVITLGAITNVLFPECFVAVELTNAYVQFSDLSWSGTNKPLTVPARFMGDTRVARPPEGSNGSYFFDVDVDEKGTATVSSTEGIQPEVKSWFESAVRQWRFLPALTEGAPTKARYSYLLRVNPHGSEELVNIMNQRTTPIRATDIDCERSPRICYLSPWE